MALGTLVVNVTIPESISSSNSDQASRAIAKYALQQVEQGIGSGLALSGVSQNITYNPGGPPLSQVVQPSVIGTFTYTIGST